MLTYDSRLQVDEPSSPASRAEALKGLRSAPPHIAFGTPYSDLVQAYGDRNAAEYDIAAQKANTQHTLNQQAAVRQLALSGLQNMAQAQQNSNSLANQSFGNNASLMSGLLSGLFN